ncbi:ABC transporter ATP-binding protein [Leucothrix sargassi]|nr:ABC transporter ATP-binding protein [Leucothrix sargassi]
MDTPDSRLNFWGMVKLLARPMKYPIAKALSAQITAQLCQLGQAFALAWIVRELLRFYYYATNTNETLDLSFGVMCFVGFSAVELVSRYLSGTFVSALQSKVKTLILDKSFSKLMTHSNDYFTSRSTGKITSNISGLPKEMSNLIDIMFLDIIPSITIALIAAIGLFFVSPIISVVLLTWFFLFQGVGLYCAIIRVPLHSKSSQMRGEAFGNMLNVVECQQSTRQASKVNYERLRLGKILDVWDRENMQYSFSSETARVYQSLFVTVFKIITIALLSALLMVGWIAASEFFLAYLITNIVIRNVQASVDRLVDLLRIHSRLENSITALFCESEIPDTGTINDFNPSHVDLALNDVSFTYAGANERLFEHLNLTFKSGERIAIVGSSGSGKSSLMKILVRTNDIISGSITMNGMPIKDLTLDNLNRLISVVPQNPNLFNRTILENLQIGNVNASFEEIVEATKKANCYDFIMRLPQQFDTFIGEKGSSLSGGQAQRVSIARALLKDAPIMIFDEATSSLDSISETNIQNAISRISKDKLVLVISHRLSTIKDFDRILVMEKGKIIEQGSHEDLLNQGSVYHSMWNAAV